MSEQLLPPKLVVPKWVKYLGASTLAALVLATILRLLTPTTPNDQPSWQQATPGVTKLHQLEKTLGQPDNITTTEFGRTAQFTSQYPALPHEVVVDDNQTIQFIREQVVHDEKDTLATYTDEYGEADLLLYGDQIGAGRSAHVFLSRGLVVIIHIVSEAVEEKWYFVPIDEEVFLRSWGYQLDSQPLGPESLLP